MFIIGMLDASGSEQLGDEYTVSCGVSEVRGLNPFPIW